MLLFYREPNGDYLAIETSTADYYGMLREHYPERTYEGRATGIAKLATSICTMAISQSFLRTCRRVAKKDIPPEWIKAISGFEG